MTDTTEHQAIAHKFPNEPERRRFLTAAAGSVLLPFIATKPAAAEPSVLDALIHDVTAGVPVQSGGMTLKLPRVADNGNSVALNVAVDSPMNTTDYVKSIHLFAPENPRPVVARYYLNPRSGRAEINTRIRLAATQEVVALAALNDGSFRKASAKVIVTVAACIDGS